MNESLRLAITTQNWSEIRRLAFSLPEKEKQQLKKNNYKEWQKMFDKKHLSYEEDYVITYLIMCVCDNADEMLKIEKRLDFTSVLSYHTNIDYYIFFLNSQHTQALLDFIHTPQGAYIVKGIQEVYTKSPRSFSFEMLWTLYKEGIIPFNEEAFVMNLYDIEYHRTKETKVADYLLQNPELATLVFPHTAKYMNYVFRTSLEWHKVFVMLEQKDYFPDRTFVNSFFEVLLNPWKKNVLDMYCRWIEGLNPTTEEVVANQYTLFALLSSTTTSLVNFSLKQLQKAATAKGFDFSAFADAFALCFTNTKVAKSQLIGLSILEQYYKQQVPTDITYREQLASLFTQPDLKVQEKVVHLLLSYFNDENLAEVVAPYAEYMKDKTKELLGKIEDPNQAPFVAIEELTSPSPKRYEPIAPPSSWDSLLFLLGDCIRNPAAHTIDIFLEGLIVLQNDSSSNLSQSFSPYIKQLAKKTHRKYTDTILIGVLHALITQKTLTFDSKYIYTWEEEKELKTKLSEKDFDEYMIFYYLKNNAEQTNPFLFRKAQVVVEYMQQNCSLPLLSTPTHLPFYIETEILIDKLLQYEAKGKQPDLDDLIVACNRLLFKDASAIAKEKAQQLKGNYASAIQYFLGLTDEVTPTEELLPLWTQITRIKHPDKEFNEFEATSAKDILGVIKPYFIDYGWQNSPKDNNPDYKKFVYYIPYRRQYSKDPKDFLWRYYNNNGGVIIAYEQYEYALSLNPHYLNGLLCSYISNWATRNEVLEINFMTSPLEIVLRYNLPIRHSGWLYIGACLLFEKRPSRDLAYEYISQAIARGEDLTYLIDYLANVLAWGYLPITRFIEFLDRPNPPAVKVFGKNVVKQYLCTVKEDALPKNHKKMVLYNSAIV